MNYPQLLAHYPLISDQVDARELGVILRELEDVLAKNIPGAVVEFGCYQGTTSLFLRRLLNVTKQAGRELHVYDSFAGLPAKSIQDASPAGSQFKAGELSVSKKHLLQEFKRAGLTAPRVHKSWFKDLSDKDVPQPIAFAFLDGDFYDSIMDSLALVWPRVSRGGSVVIDDYGREALPGVNRAVRDFFGDGQPVHHEASIAIIAKP